jgi:hypothetical protein
MPCVFMKKWEENHTPCQANKLKHSPILLKTIVKTFLSNKWAVVAYKIFTRIPCYHWK